jgi:hypothetical protein
LVFVPDNLNLLSVNSQRKKPYHFTLQRCFCADVVESISHKYMQHFFFCDSLDVENDSGGSKASSLVKLVTNIFLACFDVGSLMNEDRQYVRAQVSVTLLISHLSSSC